MKVLVTGGLGFIGSNFVRMIEPMGKVVIVDKMTYAANSDNLGDLLDKIEVWPVDIAATVAIREVFQTCRPDWVVNFADESRVDRSIESASEFVQSNVVGVQVLLDTARKYGVKRFVQVSTDEVYGDLGMMAKPFVEKDCLNPSSPYSASKAAADHLALAYVKTYGMDVVVTRCSNNYGPRQHQEKLIPLAIHRLKNGWKVPVCGKGENIRDWIHVNDHCRGIWDALTKGRKGEVYNFGGNNQVLNIVLVKMLVKLMGKTEEEGIGYVEDRPGYDLRRDIDFTKASRELGWFPNIPFEYGLKETVKWYTDEQKAPIAQLDRASASGAEGCVFNSRWGHQV